MIKNAQEVTKKELRALEDELEGAIRSVREDLLPAVEAGVTGGSDAVWEAGFADRVTRTAHKVRAHGATVAG